ncbi:hypothetical protein EG329_003740 [Mollisiaceae sp. DMI_Dod_QoI]|nr:hypothetical protein EG329_003740 [Helotiales sp. DMI_Dod_QoI]
MSHFHSHSHSFHLSKSSAHLKWDNSLPPALTIDSGTTISFDLLDGGYNQFTSTSTSSDVPNFDLSLGDPAIGPVFVNGAEPGDVLKIEFLDLQTADFGWTAVFPSTLGFGLLADEFPDPALKIWDLKTHAQEGYTVFKEGIRIPIHPFLGVVGIAREEVGEFSTIPPYETGGNIDCRHVTVGSTLFLPVKGKLTGKGEYAVLGIDSDLREASRKALRGVIEWLVGEKGLTREEGYMLASVCADLRIAEIVDMPNYAVSCAVPLSIFVGAPDNLVNDANTMPPLRRNAKAKYNGKFMELEFFMKAAQHLRNK